MAPYYSCRAPWSQQFDTASQGASNSRLPDSSRLGAPLPCENGLAMEPLFSSAWLELAIAGLVTAGFANRQLSSTQAPELCAAALAAGSAGRTAILRATCAASDSSWARLVRFALREAAPYTVSAQAEGSYRAAPHRTTSEPITRVVTAELSRIARIRTIGLGGVAVVLVGGAMLINAQSVLMVLLMVAALATAWRVTVNGRRAKSALDETAGALPDLVASLPAPPPPRALAMADPSPVAIFTSGGCLVAFFCFGIGTSFVGITAVLITQMIKLIPAKEIGFVFGVHLLLFPLALFFIVALRRRSATIDTVRGEVIFVHRMLGITYARTVAPLEIVECFFGERGMGKASSSCVGIDVAQPHQGRRRRREPKPEDHIRLVDGDRVEEVAKTLNLALGLGLGGAT
jgi:hypothetical protein